MSLARSYQLLVEQTVKVLSHETETALIKFKGDKLPLT